MAKEGTVRWLREVCGEFRRDLLSAESATMDEIAVIWPGGEKNPGTRIINWIRCYGKLHAMNAVAVRSRVDRGSVTNAERQEATLAALADTPETVSLIVGADEEPRQITVYPKSYVALNEVEKRNQQIAWLIDEDARIQQQQGPADLDELLRFETLLRSRDEQAYLHRVIVWIATSHGLNGKPCGLPFPEEDLRPTLPADFPDLHPGDLYGISKAFQNVNLGRVALLQHTRKNETRPDFNTFLVAFAGEMHRPVSDVMRDMSLSSVIAQSAERARGHEQAMVAAERERKERDRQPRSRQVA